MSRIAIIIHHSDFSDFSSHQYQVYSICLQKTSGQDAETVPHLGQSSSSLAEFEQANYVGF
ncbi:hypothetical protein BVY02_02085 [bacterium J17]|nr:hypothetical protein BVY02_02085 [bacterium J17]